MKRGAGGEAAGVDAGDSGSAQAEARGADTDKEERRGQRRGGQRGARPAACEWEKEGRPRVLAALDKVGLPWTQSHKPSQVKTNSPGYMEQDAKQGP